MRLDDILVVFLTAKESCRCHWSVFRLLAELEAEICECSCYGQPWMDLQWARIV